jgi:ribonuclease Z
MTKFELTILGTSSALPTSQRYPTAHILNVHERFFLIDCGEGTQVQLRRFHLRFSKINQIFISHLHGDHYFGLIGLLSTFILLNRQTDLHIFSHSILPELLKPQLDYIGADLTYKIIWHPLNFKKPQLLFEDEAVEVSSFPLKHRVPCCGFLFTEKHKELNLDKEMIDFHQVPIRWLHQIKQGDDFCKEDGTVIPNKALTLPPAKRRSYAFCTDTLFEPEVAKWIHDVDLLYHEATYDNLLEKRAVETMHSTAGQAATMANLACAKKLIIGHYSARYKDLEILLNQATQIFPNTELAMEGAVFPVSTSKDN